MSNIIASNIFLSENENRTLMALLELIIPADIDRGMPSAADLDFVRYLEEFASKEIPAIKNELETLNNTAKEETGNPFFKLGNEEQCEFCNQQRETNRRFVRAILVQTLNCYYQDDKVLTALGRKSGAPFPEGNEVLQGDLSLLDPVRKRGNIYRKWEQTKQ